MITVALTGQVDFAPILAEASASAASRKDDGTGGALSLQPRGAPVPALAGHGRAWFLGNGARRAALPRPSLLRQALAAAAPRIGVAAPVRKAMRR